jgi:hypothetical protein
MYVDVNARNHSARPKYKLETAYGQIEHIYLIQFDMASVQGVLDLDQDTFIFVAIRSCVLDEGQSLDLLDINYYTRLGSLDIVDITTVSV